MTLKQLTTFYWVCRLDSFAAAADYLFSTQSAVSMRIRELETSLGVELFDRSQRSARLTAKGRDLLSYAERIMSLMSEIEAQIGAPESLVGTVGLGATELVAITWLPSLVASLHEKCPEVVLKLDLDSANNQLKKLQRGAIDAAILPGPVEDSRYTKIFLGSVDFVWVASAQQKWSKGTLSPGDLVSSPILTLAPESQSYRSVDGWFKENDVPFDRRYVCNSLSVLAALAEAQVGITYLPYEAFKNRFHKAGLKTLDVRPSLPSLGYYLIFEDSLAHPALRIISDLARKVTTFDTHARPYADASNTP